MEKFEHLDLIPIWATDDIEKRLAEAVDLYEKQKFTEENLINLSKPNML